MITNYIGENYSPNDGPTNQINSSLVRYKVSISNIKLKEKPAKDDAKLKGRISRSFSTHYLTGDEIVEKILNGYSFSNIVWNETTLNGNRQSIRNNANFMAHNLFVLDYDNNCRDENDNIVDCDLAEKNPNIIIPNVGPDEFLKGLREKGLDASYILTSMSDSEKKRKFRVIWLSDIECTDPKIAALLFEGLTSAFDGDPNATLLSQYYFPCRLLVHCNPNYVLSKSDGSYERFRELIELGLTKKERARLHMDAEKKRELKSKKINAVLLEYNKGESEIQQEKKEKKIQIKAKDKELIYNHFKENSKLFRKFLSSKLKYEELKNLVLNIQYFTYGEEVVMQRMEEHDRTSKKPYVKDDYRLVQNLFKGVYSIKNLKKLHGDEYENFKYIYHHVIRKRKDVPFISLQEAEAKLLIEIQTFIQDPVPGTIRIIKSETGTGKTKHLLDSVVGVDCLIGLPTHNLITEKADKLKEKGIEFRITERLPSNLPPDVSEVISEYFAIGAIKEANRFIYNTIETHPDNECKQILQDYVENTSKALKSRGITLTTHTRLIHSETTKNLIISDEDLFSEIYSVSTITKEDFNDLKDLIDFHPELSLKTKQIFDAINQQVKKFPEVIHAPELSRIDEKDLKEIEKAIGREFRRFESKVVKFLTASRFIVKDKEILFLNQSTKQFSTSKSYLILSGTINPDYYRLLGNLGFRIEFSEIERVAHNSEFYQYDYNSNSPYSLGKRRKNNPKEFKRFIERINELNAKVITHKKEKTQFKNYDSECHFNSCSGLNHLEGKDICIVGALNRPDSNLGLLASLFDESFIGKEVPKPEHIEIESCAAHFKYYSYENKVMRGLHQQFVQESIIQAVGRCRHVRHKVKVYLINSYYLYPEAILFDLPKAIERLNAIEEAEGKI